MLYITIPETEMYDESTGEFRTAKAQTLQLEHSLVSISKWESKWRKAFLSNKTKTREQLQDYVRCMTMTKNVPPDTYSRLTTQNYATIEKYIGDPMTASCLPSSHGPKKSSESITSELIYYWMVAYNIPFECQKWHLNRLLTLIQICNMKNTPPKKRSSSEIMRHNAAVNAARRKKMHSKG